MELSINPNLTYPISIWDTVALDPTLSDAETEFDWQLVEGPGLTANAALHTAVILCLFTDRRAPEDYELPGDSSDRRGWFGDYVDVDVNAGERELGSLIWLYERSAMNDDTAEGIRIAAEDSLETLLIQRICSRIDVQEEHSNLEGWVRLKVNIFSQDGDLKYSQQFHRIWTQVHPELG